MRRPGPSQDFPQVLGTLGPGRTSTVYIIIMEKLAVSQKDCEAIDNLHIWVRGTYNKTVKQHVGYRY